KDIHPHDVSIAVLNGSGVPGVAGAATNALHFVGFDTVGSPSDAASLDHATTLVRYAPGHKSAALLVLLYLGGGGQIEEAPDVTAEDVQLVVGKDYTGVGAPTAAASTTTTVTTLPPYLGNPTPGLAKPQGANAALPLVGCPPGT